MKGISQRVLVLGVILLWAVVVCNAESPDRSAELSSDDGHQQVEGAVAREARARGPGNRGKAAKERGNASKQRSNSKKRGFPERKRGGSGQRGNQNGAFPAVNFTTECVCGKPLGAPRILEGAPTTTDAYPWQAALLSAEDETLICSGALINNLYVLTSAYCVTPYISHPADLIVRLRDNNLKRRDLFQEITKNVSEIIRHKNYDPATLRFNIALLRLESELTLTQLATVRPICLPSTSTEHYESREAIATGWGLTTPFSNQTSNALKEVTLEVIPNKRCRKSDQFYSSLVKKNMLCAINGDENTCYADEGGPLVVLTSDHYYEQVGVSSFSFSCGLPKGPAVFTRVNKFLRWIVRRTNMAAYCSGSSFSE